MTDSSSLANTLSEPLRQPYWWAALASVSLHGVLGVTAPTLSNIIYGGNSSKNIPGSVGLVELTPAETGRLPQTIPPKGSNTRFTPFSTIAPVPLRPGPKLAPPLPPAPDTINLPAMPPGMPPPGFFSPLPPSPLPPFTAPTAPPPPKTPSPTVRTPSQPTTPTIIPPVPPSGLLFPPLTGNFDPNIPPPPALTEPPPFSGVDPYDPEALQRIIAQRNIPDLSDPNDIASPPYAGETNSGAARSLNLPGKSLQLKNPMIATGRGRGGSQPFDPNNRNPDPAQPDPNLPGNPETIAKKNRDEYLALLAKFRLAYDDLVPGGPTISVKNVAYPKAACSGQLEGRGLFGAVVLPQGSLRADPIIIMATGYPILDEAAIAVIKSQTFPPASTHKLYQLAVEFKYDEKVCSGIPVTPTRPNPPGQQRQAPAPTAPRPTGQPPSPAPTEVKPQFEKPPAPSNKPQPGPKPSPSAPKPAAQPSPSPEPKPAAEQSPSPQPQPAQASPQPEAAPSPAPEVSPSPEAAPSPAPEVSPSPEVAPSPAPEVSPSPAAEVSPSPSPEAAPSPAAEVSPSPSPEAAPSPAATEN